MSKVKVKCRGGLYAVYDEEWQAQQQRWAEKVKCQAHLEFCAKHFDAMETALRSIPLKQWGETEYQFIERYRIWLHDVRLPLLATIDAERRKKLK
jgi:hypothetical protein